MVIHIQLSNSNVQIIVLYIITGTYSLGLLSALPRPFEDTIMTIDLEASVINIQVATSATLLSVGSLPLTLTPGYHLSQVELDGF